MRLVDIFLAFPGLVLALTIAGLMGPGLFNVMFALSLVGWMGYTRVVRGSVLAVKEKEFVETAKSLGANNLYILIHHILPNVIAPVIVMATLGIGHTILAAAGLSFLGLGAQPPIPVWGAMLNNGKAFMRTAPHLTIFPGLAIMITVLAFNFLGDGLRDLLDPRLKEKGIE
jgi:peptide/nickel transport system permease protein